MVRMVSAYDDKRVPVPGDKIVQHFTLLKYRKQRFGVLSDQRSFVVSRRYHVPLEVGKHILPHVGA